MPPFLPSVFSFHLNICDLTALLPVGFIVFYGLGLYWLFTSALQERMIHEYGIAE